MSKILGVDVGGTGIKGAIVDTSTGKLITERIRIKTPQPATPQAVCATIKSLCQQLDWQGPIGCGFPSTIKEGIVRTASNIDDAWLKLDIESFLKTELGMDCCVLNDADAAGIAEMSYGAGRAYSDKIVLLLTIGTGIGSSFFNRGQLFPNTELGHLLDKKGQKSEIDLSNITRKNEELTWQEWASRFDVYLHHLEFIFRPDLIILGGGASKHFEKYKDVFTIEAELLPAELLNAAGVIGAAAYASQSLL